MGGGVGVKLKRWDLEITGHHQATGLQEKEGAG